MRRPSNLIFGVAFTSIAICMIAFSPKTLWAQEDSDGQLVNGNMEQVEGEGPAAWRFIRPFDGAKLEAVTDDPFEGDHSVMLDATGAHGIVMSANLMQTLDAAAWQGKRVRLRAAVRTADLDDTAGAQLWFRVDRPDDENGKPVSGAFDNMQNRPIQNDEWQHYDIVLQIDEDAEHLAFGMFVKGSGKAWLDDVTLEEVDADTPTTQMTISRPTQTDESGDEETEESSESQSSRFQMSPILMQAMADAENAPQQPFYSHWMWLVLLAIVLFCLSAFPAKEIEYVNRQRQLVRTRAMGFVPKFALRFSVAYWLLYSFPAPFNYMTGHLGEKVGGWFQKIYSWYNEKVMGLVTWVAEYVFKISEELVPPNGSGDTTFNYILVFTFFVLALAIAVIWSAVDWRKTTYANVKDLLRSYLRYVLAVTMLGYGLAKVGWASNQFPLLADFRLERTWGDSSPMGVLWSFMGASRPYTIFAGLGEVIGGSLLLFRRTTLLGCFVVLGVMINVMVLNYCYDVPVKLYSTHLVCMTAFVMLPEARRLVNVLFLNRSTGPTPLRPPYTNNKTIWLQWAVKLGFIVLAFGFPVYKHIDREVQYFADLKGQPEFFGAFDVIEFKLNDEVISETGSTVSVWQTIKFERQAYNRNMERVPTNWIMIGLKVGAGGATFSTQDEGQLEVDPHENAMIPQGQIEIVKVDEQTYTLSGDLLAGRVEATLKRQSPDRYRLTGRGYRWINEVPFNR